MYEIKIMRDIEASFYWATKKDSKMVEYKKSKIGKAQTTGRNVCYLTFVADQRLYFSIFFV